MDETVVLTVLGNSPADSTTSTAGHTLQVGDQVFVFARQTEIQWWDGNPPQLVEGQQGSYYEVGRKEVLTFVGAPPGPPFCIVWIDNFDDERGFRVHLNYPRSGERFIYEVGPDVTQLIVPVADAPRLDESWQQCDGRKDFDVLVMAVRDIEWQVGGMASMTHCPPTLPTATVSPMTSSA